MAGNFDEARALASRARTIYEELAWTIYVWTNWATVAADIELLAGDYTSAELILSESCRQLGEWGEHAHLATQAAQLGQALYGQGRYEDAAEWGATAALRAATDDAGAQFLSMALRAKTLAQFGEFEQAEALGGRAVSFAAETDALSQHASVLLDVAEVARLEGRLADESTMIEQAVALFESKGNVAGSAAARSTHRGESARA
jgi:tetratricopeptide (TPR) repeat protein